MTLGSPSKQSLRGLKDFIPHTEDQVLSIPRKSWLDGFFSNTLGYSYTLSNTLGYTLSSTLDYITNRLDKTVLQKLRACK